MKKKIKKIIKNNDKIYSMYLRLRKKGDKYKAIHTNKIAPISINQRDIELIIKKWDSYIIKVQKDIESCKIKWEENTNFVKFEDYEILSYKGDVLGKVFVKDGIIYRGIYKEKYKEFQKLWETGILQALSKNKILPQMEISNYKNEIYCAFIKIEKLPISYSQIWSFSEVRDACILIAFLKEILNKNGYTLLDGHLNNVTFSNGRPIFIDIGSIIPNRFSNADEELVFVGCYKLLFEQLGNCILSRMSIYDPDNNSIWVAPRFYDENTREYRYCLKEFMEYHSKYSSKICNRIIKEIFIKHNILPSYIETIFGISPLEEMREYKSINLEMFLNILKLINNNEIESILVINYFQEDLLKCIIKYFGEKDIKFISDNENEVDAIYNKNKNWKFKMNIFIYSYLYGGADRYINLFKSDVVILFNFGKMLENYTIDNMVEALSKLGKKYIIISDLLECEKKYDEFKFKWKFVYRNEFIYENQKMFMLLLKR